MREKTILVVIPVREEHRELLEEAAPGNHFVYSSIREVSREQVQEADIILGNVPADKIRASKKLQWLQLNSAGADAYTGQGILDENTVVTTANGAYGKTVSEHMFAMLLAMQKKLHLYRDSQNKHIWDEHGTVTSIADSTVLIFGMGDIGRHFAKMAHALGAYVIGVKKSPGNCPEYIDEPHLMKDCRELLPHADVVVSFLPSTPETRGLALDVTTPEPLPADHRLWDYPNVFITPHVSGFYHLPETLDKVVNICTENLKRYMQGQKLRNIMDFQAGYCSGNKK